jgi:hypothetical protein
MLARDKHSFFLDQLLSCEKKFVNTALAYFSTVVAYNCKMFMKWVPGDDVVVDGEDRLGVDSNPRHLVSML